MWCPILVLIVVSDFWTTGCGRCPGALDKLNMLASDPMYDSVNFVSICCDSLDGARSMIDWNEEPRWSNVRHFFVDAGGKEKAKEWLGFSGVPFYALVDRTGVVVDSGGQGFDVDGAVFEIANASFLQPFGGTVGQRNPMHSDGGTKWVIQREEDMERTFVLDDDF